MAINVQQKNINEVKDLQNKSFDPELELNIVEPIGFDGKAAQRMIGDSMAVKMTVDGAVTYLGLAAPGTAQATAKWQLRKIDETSGMVITWCDGNAAFDNTATDLSDHDYS